MSTEGKIHIPRYWCNRSSVHQPHRPVYRNSIHLQRADNPTPAHIAERLSTLLPRFHDGVPINGGVPNVEIRHSMPPISACFIECKAFGRNHHLHFQNTTG